MNVEYAPRARADLADIGERSRKVYGGGAGDGYPRHHSSLGSNA
jgi:hypothetical protein